MPADMEMVTRLFEIQAGRAPGAAAVVAGNSSLTYGELNARAEELAGRLRSLGAGAEAVVGVRLPRSAAMVAGVLGILKSGAAYLPLDVSEPGVRADFMLRDAGVSVLVTSSASTDIPESARRSVILLDDSGRVVSPSAAASEHARAPAGPRNLAYVIYTSGSTGSPKGVEVAHASLSNLVSWHRDAFAVSPKDRASCVARVGFDAGVWEIWPYLASGASLHVPGPETLNDPAAFQSWLVSEQITISFVPTPMAERLLALPWPAGTALRFLLTGGDTLHSYAPPGLPFVLVNNYGPTECAVVATSGLVPSQRSLNHPPSIGRPIPNTEIYILDDNLRETAPGVPGEIHIGGVGVARGYRNRPELTGERFIPNPLPGKSNRLFKTGDCAQWLPDRQIAFLGRLDDQIKIRGFRIEPSEIVAALNEHPGLSGSVVVAREAAPGELRLVAYVVSAAQAVPTFSELRDFVGGRLPGYMVPSTFVALDSLPLTPNGKVDRSALPPPSAANTITDAGSRRPQTEVEEVVAGILARLLGTEEVDVEANFFSLGGHSLLGIQLISRVRECLGVELSLRAVFEAPSVAELSAEIERLLCAKLEAMSEEEVQRTLNSPEPTPP